MPRLDQIIKPTARRGQGCAICGGKRAAYVTVTIQKLDANGERKGGSKSHARTLCEEHAVQAFLAMRDHLLGNDEAS